ncbi:FtsX-like permease family protein [Lyngbya confervoides]|uniref:FtsX-like permease family protein n=1 Tax=Lyngbya confervoides BDU141951 TaxID=1574623 RepID=A0ABD4T849_9CYAN|nr:FtsX-like permease family protein [Lyngbya confervoides]MCM1984477.1 FtsX-like permease family protein [Lyngbya confervoides BDU141951]
MTSLARKNLFNDIPRLLMAQAGIVFAVSLVTIQIGILRGFLRSTSLMVQDSQADLWVASKDMVSLTLTLPLPYPQLNQAQAVAGVERAEPLLLRNALWRDAKQRIAPVTVVGLDPQGKLLSPGALSETSLQQLSQPYSLITDHINLGALNLKKVGDKAAIGSVQAKLLGLAHHIQSTAYDPLLFTSLASAKVYGSATLPRANAAPQAPVLQPFGARDNITYILVQAKPGENLQLIKQRLNSALPDTQAYTRRELMQKIQSYWVQRTSIVFILGLGAAVGIIVGVVIVSQILYASVKDHLREFGTLKAIGLSDRDTYAIVIEQALWMALLGYVPSMTLCLALGAWTSVFKGVIILITPGMGIAIFGMTVVMCTTSALFALQRVTQVDPAVVFSA